MSDPTPTDCPSTLKLIIYVDSPVTLDEAEYIRIREHLKVCPDCRYKVFDKGMTDESDTEIV